jgi:benzylsuccinate CoA-transferase BbsF subunit
MLFRGVNMSKQPFEGLKVIDMSWSGAGVFIMNFLSHYGATLVRVESAKQPDPIRRVWTYTNVTRDTPNALNRSAYFAFSHPAKKMDLTLDLKNPKAMEIMRKLVKWADVLGESFPTGVMERFGLGYDDLKKVKENIIMLRSCGYGHTGPMAKQAGFGMTLAAYSMMYTVAGWPDRRGVPVSSYYSDQMSPLFSILALVTAIDNLRRTGRGQCIDQSQIESTINFLTPLVLDYTVNKRESKVTGNKSSYMAPHGVYRCKGNERWIAIAVTNDSEWQSFCQITNNPDWIQDPRFVTLDQRVKHSDELDKLVESWTIAYAPEYIMAALQGAGVPAGVVSNSQDIVEDVQLKQYNFFREVEHPFMGKLPYAHAPAMKLSDAEASVGRATILGENNEYVCKDILGYSQAEYDQLVKDKVFE